MAGSLRKSLGTSYLSSYIILYVKAGAGAQPRLAACTINRFSLGTRVNLICMGFKPFFGGIAPAAASRSSILLHDPLPRLLAFPVSHWQELANPDLCGDVVGVA